MTIKKLIEALQQVEDSNQEARLQDIATNYIYRIFKIKITDSTILIEDTEE